MISPRLEREQLLNFPKFPLISLKENDPKGEIYVMLDIKSSIEINQLHRYLSKRCSRAVETLAMF